jgi:hypothetical protein
LIKPFLQKVKQSKANRERKQTDKEKHKIVFFVVVEQKL